MDISQTLVFILKMQLREVWCSRWGASFRCVSESAEKNREGYGILPPQGQLNKWWKHSGIEMEWSSDHKRSVKWRKKEIGRKNKKMCMHQILMKFSFCLSTLYVFFLFQATISYPALSRFHGTRNNGGKPLLRFPYLFIFNHLFSGKTKPQKKKKKMATRFTKVRK